MSKQTWVISSVVKRATWSNPPQVGHLVNQPTWFTYQRA